MTATPPPTPDPTTRPDMAPAADVPDAQTATTDTPADVPAPALGAPGDLDRLDEAPAGPPRAGLSAPAPRVCPARCRTGRPVRGKALRLMLNPPPPAPQRQARGLPRWWPVLTVADVVLSAAMTAVALAVVTTGSAHADAAIVDPAALVEPVVDVLAQAPASIDAVLTNLRNWLLGILVGLSTLVCTVAGIRYVASQGDPGEVERAKAGLRNGAWGYAIAVLAPALVEILKQIVGGG